MTLRALLLPLFLTPALVFAQVDTGAQESTAADDDAVYVVTQHERVVPGTEPHTPSTLGNEWTARDNRRISPAVVGSNGLLRVSSATLGPAGMVRFSTFGEYFNQRNFPETDAHNVRTAGTFAVSFVPLPWLETFLAYGAATNTNNLSDPTLIQALGDITLGAKLSYQWTRGLDAGLELKFQSFSAVGNQDVSHSAWGFIPRALVTYDVREVVELPLVLHANVGAAFDGTGGLVGQDGLTSAEEYALNVNRYNRFTTGLGIEVPLPAVTPFVEYNLGVPMGVEGGVLTSPNGETVALSAAMPQTLGLGLKITAVRDLTLNAGCEFGLAQSVARGVPATPPWNLVLGAAFNVDPFQRGEVRVVETLRERKVRQKAAPSTAKIEGVVVDAQTHKPIEGVIVAAAGSGLPPVASDVQTGRFLTHDLKPGAITLKAVRTGYKETARELRLEAGQTAKVELALEPEAALAHFMVSVTGGDKKKAPIAAAVTFQGPKEQTLLTAAAATEPAKLEVPPGKYLVDVVAAGHLAQTREVQVSEGAEMKLAFQLEPQPRKKLVLVKDDKIEILQQVHFQSGQAAILADSYSLLNQVVDAIVKSGIKRVRIEGHTDNRGGTSNNLKLSQDRAQAVADYLVKQGIDSTRVEAIGHGETKPVAPNLTARGRELNRRVEFHIVER